MGRCAYMDMAEDLVLRVVEGSDGFAGKVEGVVRLVGGGRGKTEGGGHVGRWAWAGGNAFVMGE